MSDEFLRPQTVREYQAMLAHIYQKANKRYSDEHLLLRLFEEVSGLMEVVRKDKRGSKGTADLTSRLARTYSWWNAVATRSIIDLQDALWHKYPDVCPWCLQRPNCHCGLEHPDIPLEHLESRLRMFRREREKEPKSLSDHVRLHHRLYGWHNDQRMPIQTAAHISEEVGEISKEFRHSNFGLMEDEMADMGSWLFQVANRFTVALAEAVWEQYPYECEKCRNTVCVCKCSDPPE